MRTNMQTPAGAGTPKNHRWGSESPRLREDRLRKLAARAYLRIRSGNGNELAAAIGKDHKTISNRKKGLGPLANLLIEQAALEAEGHDTTSMIEALVENKILSQRVENACPLAIAREEQEHDSAEDAAQVAYLTGTGSIEAWRAAGVRYLTFWFRRARQLGGHS